VQSAVKPRNPNEFLIGLKRKARYIKIETSEIWLPIDNVMPLIHNKNMSSKIFSFFGSLIAVSAFSLPALAQVPSMYNSWKKENGTNKVCLEKANKALKDLNLQQVKPIRGGVTGRTNQSVVSIACVAQNGEYVVFLSIASNNDAQARELREQVRQKL